MGANGLGIDAPGTALPVTCQETLMEHPPYRGFGYAKQACDFADRQARMLIFIVALPLDHILISPRRPRPPTLRWLSAGRALCSARLPALMNCPVEQGAT
jgi:hypothetical protein